MRDLLARWVSDADALHHIHRLGLDQTPLQLSYVRTRKDDYFISLLGELFARIREPYSDPEDWSRLGNALTQAGALLDEAGHLDEAATLPPETALFAASAFYFGGFPASALLTLNASDGATVSDIHQSCIELLARPSTLRTERVQRLVDAVRRGDLPTIGDSLIEASGSEAAALQLGPDEWIGWRLFSALLKRFARTNLRAVLPDGETRFWDPLVQSLIDRSPPAWDFFPSQIEAIQSGLLENPSTYSLQMPTGAGKTALSEVLLFHHLRKRPREAAILLVPYRSLASELRRSLVRRLNDMGLPTKCIYGGTVPSGAEVHELEDTRAIVATPEAISGLLSSDSGFFNRVGLVICDEGHLLDMPVRGAGLEMLLARMRARTSGPPKFVFVSAIVPNIEEINAWLGGSAETVVRSNYRPAIAEFSRLIVSGAGASATVALQLHPQEREPRSFFIERFLCKEDFLYVKPETGRRNTYRFDSFKTQAIATARKALGMGVVAIFAANKRGNQGAIGLAQELLTQIASGLPLPTPVEFIADQNRLEAAVEYLSLEYGSGWVGTQILKCGAVLHHGDVPQESREVLEELVRDGTVRMAICTSTLAEGVNLPIRTLVLYSVRRGGPDGVAENLLARDIKNLVGRAGRAGASTKGLVICVNSNQWNLVKPVARQEPGEAVAGALVDLMQRLRGALRQSSLPLSNEILEGVPDLHSLVDGVDTTLVDLISEELGEKEFARIAANLADQTFAAQQAEDPDSLGLIREVFVLRSQKVASLQRSGRISWIRETGARVRLLDSVESDLLPLRERWDNVESAADEGLIKDLLSWVWVFPEMERSLAKAYRDSVPTLESFAKLVTSWIEGLPLQRISEQEGIEIDTLLGIHGSALSFVLQTAVEQGIVLLKKLVEASGQSLSPAVVEFPEHLRFGVPTAAARVLAAGGVRHRRAAVTLGESRALASVGSDNRQAVFRIARRILEDERGWSKLLGRLVLERTKRDLVSAEESEDLSR